ncbi:hypothetical protein VTK56DRAFT_9844 [Thermocarpiscus australiensis]
MDIGGSAPLGCRNQINRNNVLDPLVYLKPADTGSRSNSVVRAISSRGRNTYTRSPQDLPVSSRSRSKAASPAFHGAEADEEKSRTTLGSVYAIEVTKTAGAFNTRVGRQTPDLKALKATNGRGQTPIGPFRIRPDPPRRVHRRGPEGFSKHTVYELCNGMVTS